MKTKTQPLNVKSGNYLDQALMEGLNKKQRDWAKIQVKKFEDFGVAVPYGLIRKGALAKK
jgi:hypothetical protein